MCIRDRLRAAHLRTAEVRTHARGTGAGPARHLLLPPVGEGCHDRLPTLCGVRLGKSRPSGADPQPGVH
eukprot:3967207-Alexandrium_andersonii.AAC.1